LTALCNKLQQQRRSEKKKFFSVPLGDWWVVGRSFLRKVTVNNQDTAYLESHRNSIVENETRLNTL
jgi:hypothetical protein